jgi:hypothetical protein
MTTLVSLIEKMMQDRIGFGDPKLLNFPDYHIPYFDELEYVAQAAEYVAAVDRKANVMNELEQVKFKGALVKFGAVAETILREWGELDHGWILYARAQVAANELDIHKLRPCTTVAYSDSNHEQASLVELHYYIPIAEPHPDYRNYGKITATHAPADQTRLTVYADPEYQDEMFKQWARLKAELIRQEWIDPPTARVEALVHTWPPGNEGSQIKAVTENVLICDEWVRTTPDNLIKLVKDRLQSGSIRVAHLPGRFELALFTMRRADADLPADEQMMQQAFARVAIEPIDERCRLWVALDYAPDDLLPYPARAMLTDVCAAVIAVCNGRAAADEWRTRIVQPNQAGRVIVNAEDCDRFELVFLDTPARLAREVAVFDAYRNIYTVDDRDYETIMDDLINRRHIATRRIAPDADLVTVSFLAEHIMGTFSASCGHITARAMRDGTSQLIVTIGRNPGTLGRWSDLRAELERLGLLTLPPEATNELTHHQTLIVRDADARRVAAALATAWQTRWVKLLSDVDTLVTQPATMIAPRGPITHYVVRVRGHVIRHDDSRAFESDLLDVLRCEVIQGGDRCKVQIDYMGEANDWRLYAIDELNEIFHTDAVGMRHKGSIFDLPAERAALIIGDAIRELDHDLFSVDVSKEPGGRWVWSVYYGADNRKPRIGEITVGPDRGVGFASVAMARALKRDPELATMTPRERDEIGQFGRLVTHILDMGAFEAENIKTPPAAPTPTESSTQPVVVETSGGVNVDANNVVVGNDVVGRDKITNTQNIFYLDPISLTPAYKLAAQQPPFPPVTLIPSSVGYLGRDDVSLLIRTAYVTRGLARKPWTSEEREAIRAWLQISPLCQWMDSYLHLQSEAFSWKIDQTLANSLRLSYMPRLSPDDSPLSVKAELYTYGVACFDVIFGTLEAMERFLRLPPLSSAFLSERARRFQSEQRVLWSEAFQITLAGLATVTHPKLLQWFSERVGPPRLHVYLLANGVNLDQRIGGDERWTRTEGIAGRDTFLQGDDRADGMIWQAEGLEKLNELVQRMWEKHLYNWGYLGFEAELEQQPPESVFQGIRAACDSV